MIQQHLYSKKECQEVTGNILGVLEMEEKVNLMEIEKVLHHYLGVKCGELPDSTLLEILK